MTNILKRNLLLLSKCKFSKFQSSYKFVSDHHLLRANLFPNDLDLRSVFICSSTHPKGFARLCRLVPLAFCGVDLRLDPLTVVYGPRGEFNDSHVDLHRRAISCLASRLETHTWKSPSPPPVISPPGLEI